MARHLVALKMFYRYLRLEERADAAAVDLLGSPKLWERIPQVLSPTAVEELLDSQPGDRFYLRDRCLNAIRHGLPGFRGGGAESRRSLSRCGFLPVSG